MKNPIFAGAVILLMSATASAAENDLCSLLGNQDSAYKPVVVVREGKRKAERGFARRAAEARNSQADIVVPGAPTFRMECIYLRADYDTEPKK